MTLHKKEFKPRAKLLLELGDQLIKDEGIAVFELVKNSYDADAKKVDVILEQVDDVDLGKIIIQDDGHGMDIDTVLNAWMEPGTNYRKRQLDELKRSKKFKRLPLGEKGIGRFGAHKLGKKINLYTKASGSKEVQIEIDWSKFEQDKYLDQIKIEIHEVENGYFGNNKTGTRLVVTNLNREWNRGMVRDLYRSINSICSPFVRPDSFVATLHLDVDKNEWLEGLLAWDKVKPLSLFKAKCKLENDTLSYEYNFIPWETMPDVQPRKLKGKIKLTDDETGKIINLKNYKIGSIEFDLYIYDFDSKFKRFFDFDKNGITKFLKKNGGVRVYRDNVRVYDYGEEGNDWLGLDVRRVNMPAKRISNNLILSEVRLRREESGDLIEKTNREGFVENPAVKLLRKSLLCAIAHIETERNIDKEELKEDKEKGPREPVIDDLQDLRKKLLKKKILHEYEKDIDKVEKNFLDIKERLLTSAGAGLSLSIVIHEVQKIISELKLVAKKHNADSRIKELINRLSEVTEGYAMLIRQEGKKKVRASDLLTQAKFNVEYRLEAHKINVIENIDNFDFDVTCNRRLILGALMNLIDNSIWWLEQNESTKTIYLGLTGELKGGPAIIIADNGPGFIDDAEYVVQPFFTRKPNGLGLGLHITDQIMKVHKGKFLLLGKGDVKLPKEVSGGAVVALMFAKE